jgi:sortase A
MTGRSDAATGKAGRAFRATVRTAGELLVTAGVILMLYVVYELYGVTGQINAEQEILSEGLDERWDAEIGDLVPSPPPDAEEPEEPEAVTEGEPAPPLGEAFARMWAPDIRPEPWVLVEGTEPADIESAPGRWLGGALPGEQGNFTLAGHNVPAIFQHIRALEPGDKVVIETRDRFYVYEVQEHVIVHKTEVEILLPVPREPGADPGDDDYWLTLFTCNPLWDNYERYVVFANLTETYTRLPDGALPEAATDADA